MPQPIEASVLRVLADQQALVILDNCEHLIDACARLAQMLLEGCPQLAILATCSISRRGGPLTSAH